MKGGIIILLDATAVFTASLAIVAGLALVLDIEYRERKKREANAMVADILAAWVHLTFVPATGIKKRNQLIYEMQTTYWKSMVWIDKDLLKLLNDHLTAKEGSMSTHELLVQTRQYVQGKKKFFIFPTKPDMTSKDIVDWSDLIQKESSTEIKDNEAKEKN
jgi:hypothetical protein